MALDKLVEEIVAQLDELSDPGRIEMAGKNYPTSMSVKGVAVPNIRPIVKDLRKQFKSAPAEEVMGLAKLLNATRILEAQQIAFVV